MISPASSAISIGPEGEEEEDLELHLIKNVIPPVDEIWVKEEFVGEAASYSTLSYDEFNAEESTTVIVESSTEPSIHASCTASEYLAWLKEFRLSEYKAPLIAEDVEAQTSIELFYQRPFLCYCSLVKKNFGFGTEYYSYKEPRRHWILKNSGTEVLCPSHYPHIPVSSRHGRYHFQYHVGAAIPETNYKLRMAYMVNRNVIEALVSQPQLRTFILSDVLSNVKWFDWPERVTFIRNLRRFLSRQIHLQHACLENARLTRVEGVVLLCALSENCGDTLLHLHIHKMFDTGHNPMLMDELSITGKKKYPQKMWTRCHMLEILEKFSMLTHLSINYSYLANQRGDALISLKCVTLGRLQELTVLCLEEERPLKGNPGYGIGGWTIKDGVWRHAKRMCPELRVKFFFVNLPNYDNIILFLSKNIPMTHVYISSGIDLHVGMHISRAPWEVDSTLLELRNWYSDTLECLSLHLWHHRDLLDYIIGEKILMEFPNLRVFEFIGELADLNTLEKFCCDLSTGEFKIRHLLFWVQEIYTKRRRDGNFKARVDEIKGRYCKMFETMDIDVNIQIYST